MKHLFFLLLLPVLLLANYEPRLKTFHVRDHNKVIFHLDNGWTFEGHFFDPNKAYALDKLLGMQVRIDTCPQSQVLELSIENPGHRGHDRISFPGFINKATYDSLLVVKDITFENPYYFWHNAYITLSDGSRWSVQKNLGIHLIKEAWAFGDRILVTRNYQADSDYTLVNLDVSGRAYADYLENNYERWYSMRDPRSVLVSPVSK